MQVSSRHSNLVMTNFIKIKKIKFNSIVMCIKTIVPYTSAAENHFAGKGSSSGFNRTH